MRRYGSGPSHDGGGLIRSALVLLHGSPAGTAVRPACSFYGAGATYVVESNTPSSRSSSPQDPPDRPVGASDEDDIDPYPVGGVVQPWQAGLPLKYAGMVGESVGGLVESSTGARGGWLKLKSSTMFPSRR